MTPKNIVPKSTVVRMAKHTRNVDTRTEHEGRGGGEGWAREVHRQWRGGGGGGGGRLGQRRPILIQRGRVWLGGEKN